MRKRLKQLVFDWHFEWVSLKKYLAYLRQEWCEAREEHQHWLPALYKFVVKFDWIDENFEAFEQKFQAEAKRELLKKRWGVFNNPAGLGRR